MNRNVHKNMVTADSSVVTVTALAASSGLPPIWAAKLKELIDAGCLGMKSGSGFYTGYDPEAGNLSVDHK